jgi:3-methyladenine DNA glycosylase AlkD
MLNLKLLFRAINGRIRQELNRKYQEIEVVPMAKLLNIDVINELENRLVELSKQPDLTTGMVRAMSANVFKLIEDKGLENVLELCEQLLEKRRWALGVVAYDWAFRMKKQYKKETFYIFEGWLKKYVRSWGDCDDFCTHAFGELLLQYNSFFENILEWTEHKDFWVRRGAAVILIYPIKKGKLTEQLPFLIADRLMKDEHHLVLKGYGWMLKVLSTVKPEDVFEYLKTNKSQMPRISLRYAIEKFDKDKKTILMEA